MKQGFKFHLNTPGHESMSTREGAIFNIIQKQNLYIICNITSNTESRSAATWHQLLGHNNYYDLLKLPAVVTGMNLKEDTAIAECPTCIKAKMSQHFSKKPANRSTKPFEHISCDLNGPITDHESYQEDPSQIPKYVAGFVDDYTAYISMYIIRSKCDTHVALQNYLVDINELGTIKKIRTDQGTEFKSNHFEDILLKNNIRHEFSSPYSPHQNSRIERQWRSLFDMVRCLLIDSNVPIYLWPYAVIMAAYIRNRVFNRRIGMTPLEAATGERPNLANLRLFGCLCYPYIQKQHRKKLDPHATEGVFLGYDKKSPGFIILFPRENSIRIVREVKFTTRYYFSENTQDTLKEIEDTIPKMASSYTNPSRNKEEEPSITRYPLRTRQRTQHYGVGEDEDLDSVSNIHYINSVNNIKKVIETPSSYRQAIRSPQYDKWNSAMKKELMELKENNTFSLVYLPPGAKAIGGKWVYKISSPPGEELRFRARYVAKGFSQQEGINYAETFSPTCKFSTIKIATQICIDEGMLMHQADVNSAFLNAELDYAIYITQPEGFISDHSKVWKLHKSLYGLKQSAHLWNEKLISFMLKQNFTKSPNDPCLFTKFTAQIKMFVIIWVDDLIICSNNSEALDLFKSNFGLQFKIKDMGELSFFLGMEFVRKNNTISINQTLYANSILERFGMENCAGANVPCNPSVYTLVAEEYDSKLYDDPTAYRELIGSLIYLMVGTRPDLTFITTLLSRFMHAPKVVHFKIGMGVLKYIKNTLEYSLTYCKSATPLEVSGYSDSDFASIADRRSISGYCFQLSPESALISWKTCRQSIVATSTCEAEFMALHECAKEALYLRKIWGDFTNKPMQCVSIKADNLGAIELSKNPSFHKRSKHISIKFMATRDYIKTNYVKVTYIPSAQNLADLFTKPLSRVKLNSFDSIRGPK